MLSDEDTVIDTTQTLRPVGAPERAELWTVIHIDAASTFISHCQHLGPFLIRDEPFSQLILLLPRAPCCRRATRHDARSAAAHGDRCVAALSMRPAALPHDWRAPQLHAAAPASATRALPVCTARPRSAQRDTRFHAALAVRGCRMARYATRRFSWRALLWLTSSPLGHGRTHKAHFRTALQPAPRGGTLVASAGEVRGGVFFNRAAELKSLATLLAGPPRAVLVLTGPPSCGKSGARSPGFACLGLC